MKLTIDKLGQLANTVGKASKQLSLKNTTFNRFRELNCSGSVLRRLLDRFRKVSESDNLLEFPKEIFELADSL
ncbi:MAG: hypothetical protein AAFU53_08090, partial [Cyanobacteria bacterium J06632_3]